MKQSVYFLMFFFISNCYAQENISYQKPPAEIMNLVDVQPAPYVLIDENNEYMVLSYRDPFKTIAELSEKEYRLGGLRIDPKTNIDSRTNYYRNLKIIYLRENDLSAIQVTGLPENPRLTNFSWSPDQKKMAFTNTSDNGVELWVLDLASARVNKLTDARVNANTRGVISWFNDSNAMLVKMIAEDREALIDVENTIPTGPVISEADGKKAQNRTYQDLLKNKNDEYNFEQLVLSDLYKISLNGDKEKWLGSAMYSNIDFSPDGNYVMISTIERPFSYLVTYYRFPSKTNIYSNDAALIKTVLEVPLIEDLPKGFDAVRKGKRSLRWRNDKAATLVFVEALDDGDPKNTPEYRDEVFQWEAPFKAEPLSILKTHNRFSGITWGNDMVAIAYDSWWVDRNTKTYCFNPSDPNQQAKIISDRSSQDRYSDPGRFLTKNNEFGARVLTLKKNKAFLLGAGFSDKGQFPFIDIIDLDNFNKKRLYQSEYTDKYENLRKYDPEKNRLLVSIESNTEFPNYYFRNLKNNALTRLTSFENPFISIQNVHKEVISYNREDGLELSGTLYLPVDYDKSKMEKYPMILWAYPREFKDKASASQNTLNPNRFTSPNWGSPIYWVTRGYVVLDGAAFPIVGEGDTEPNDSFRKQLVSNAKAAIDAVDQLGYIDRNRVAVGGHSYGAFMVANLLSHSDLFAAGIARSGAYNRTLTPFGFQSEQRSYWDAPEVYYAMSPFMHADKMKTPLLLTHGIADNNSGTYPLQSERYFNALKGLGATVRLVMLPMESHGYAAKESILHLLWEQDQWLEKYVKNRVVTP